MESHQEPKLVSQHKVAEIILDVEIPKVLDYAIPVGMEKSLHIGSHVKVPLRNTSCTGYVYQLKSSSPYASLKSISSNISNEPLLSKDLFTLAQWIQSYYCCTINQSLRCILPSQIRKSVKAQYKKYLALNFPAYELEARIQTIQRAPKQVLLLQELSKHPEGLLVKDIIERKISSQSVIAALESKDWIISKNVEYHRSPLKQAEFFKTPKKTLQSEQKEAVASILNSFSRRVFQPHLLYGVTGSGKTEVYLQTIEKVLEEGQQVIVLIPEISLTEQTISRFRQRFDGHLAVFHHRLSDGEKRDEWHRMRKGEVQIVIGARSAIFAPFSNLGLIIVDEEHEGSYKSERSPTYHARDVALMRGKIQKCPVVLGSATPSIESFYNVENKGYILNTLSKRATNAPLPKVHIVDMKREWERKRFLYSQLLIDAIGERFKKGEQSILFLNRRGFHTSLICKSCGDPLQCPDCSMTLTFHKNHNKVSCHLCGYSKSPPPKKCSSCKSETIEFKGIGTERVESSLQQRFPEIRTLRIDADTTSHKGSLERKLQQFRTQKADVLIGTQMIAKGLDFPSVTLVGVLNADGPMNIPDFRSTERAFQLITQVAGRAGRGQIPGEVIIQSFLPEHWVINCASEQNYDRFYHEEIKVRSQFNFPPFSKMIKISFQSSNAQLAESDARLAYQYFVKGLDQCHFIHPPHPCGYQKVKGIFRFQILIRGKSILTMTKLVRQILPNLDAKVRKNLDVDPLSTFF